MLNRESWASAAGARRQVAGRRQGSRHLDSRDPVIAAAVRCRGHDVPGHEPFVDPADGLIELSEPLLADHIEANPVDGACDAEPKAENIETEECAEHIPAPITASRLARCQRRPSSTLSGLPCSAAAPSVTNWTISTPAGGDFGASSARSLRSVEQALPIKTRSPGRMARSAGTARPPHSATRSSEPWPFRGMSLPGPHHRCAP
jgi:hypothetical protein